MIRRALKFFGKMLLLAAAMVTIYAWTVIGWAVVG